MGGVPTKSEVRRNETERHVTNGTENGNATKQRRVRLLDSTDSRNATEGETNFFLLL